MQGISVNQKYIYIYCFCTQRRHEWRGPVTSIGKKKSINFHVSNYTNEVNDNKYVYVFDNTWTAVENVCDIYHYEKKSL